MKVVGGKAIVVNDVAHEQRESPKGKTGKNEEAETDGNGGMQRLFRLCASVSPCGCSPGDRRQG
jgi:hypothetical protein